MKPQDHRKAGLNHFGVRFYAYNPMAGRLLTGRYTPYEEKDKMLDQEKVFCVTGLHHIAIIVSSERSLEFYRLLGFSETFRKKREYDTVVLMDGYGVQLEVFIDSRHIPAPSPEPLGLRHLALRVEKLDDEIARLKAEEIEVGPIMNDWSGGRFCFIKDFDGLSIELHE